MTTKPTTTRALWLATLAASTMLVACQREESQTAGQQVDSAVASAERRTDAAVARVDAATDRMGQKVDQAADAIASKAEDAAITASVNAELARDASLSALRINVDTSGGRVVLSGTAPDVLARERATQLAAAVKGVTSVDNRLEVRG